MRSAFVVPALVVLIDRPKMPVSSLPPAPRRNCRSSSMRTNMLRRVLTYCWIAGASSRSSSLIGSTVAIFRIGSVTSL